MGKCKYCGKSAGFLRTQHKECAIKFKKLEEERLKQEIISNHNNLNSIINNIKNNNLDNIEINDFIDYGLNSFLKKEKLVLANITSKMFETKKKITYQGGSNGVSFRVAKGVTLRTGRSKGERIETDFIDSIGSGHIFLSTSGIYFKSQSKNIRIRYNKIAGFQEFSDGFSITKDTATAKPIIFELDPQYSKYIFNILLLLANNDKK